MKAFHHRGPMFSRVCALIILLSAATGLAQTTQSAPAEPGENLRCFLVTFGPGDEIWEKFAHNAILVFDQASGKAVAYNFGVFDFEQPHFIGKYILGRLNYQMESVDPGMSMIDYYIKEYDRDVWLDELQLLPRQRLAMKLALEANDTDATRFYRYDYYRDNCSTRVRDVIDKSADGELSRQLKGVPGEHTYRWHTKVLAAGNPWFYAGINFILGPAIDRPIDKWEESFLPLKFREYAGQVIVPVAEGGRRPLFLGSQQFNVSKRPPIDQRLPMWCIGFLVTGLVLGGGMLLPMLRSTKWTRGLSLTSMIVWSILAGVAGAFLVFGWGFTDHAAVHGNRNLSLFNPLMLAAVIGLIARRRVGWLVAPVGYIVLALGVVVLAVNPFLRVQQDMTETTCLALPAMIGFALAARIWRHRLGRSNLVAQETNG